MVSFIRPPLGLFDQAVLCLFTAIVGIGLCALELFIGVTLVLLGLATVRMICLFRRVCSPAPPPNNKNETLTLTLKICIL